MNRQDNPGDFFTVGETPTGVVSYDAYMKDLLREASREGAKEAIAELRKTQKRGRSDTAGGSKVIGDITRRYRGEDGYLVGIAAEAGVHPTTLGKIESGQRGMSLATFAKLAKVLGSDYVKDVLKALAP